MGSVFSREHAILPETEKGETLADNTAASTEVYKDVREEARRRTTGKSREMSGVHEESDDDPDQPECSRLSYELGICSITEKGNSASLSVNRQISERDIININVNAAEVVLNTPAQESYDAVRDEMSHISEGLAKIYSMEEAWMIPLPFDQELLLNPKDHFVELDMEFLDPSGRFTRGSLTQLSALLDPFPKDEDGSRPKHILLRGDAGFGKSTLCTKIGYDWAKKKTTFPSLPFDNTLLVLFRLRELPERSDPEQVLLEMVHSHSSEPEEDISGTRKLLRKYKGNLLLLLDGYDEISKDKQDQVKNSFLKMKPSSGPQSVFRNAVVIMTSRVYTDFDLLRLFDRHFRLKELSKTSALRLCILYFENLNGFNEGLFTDVRKVITEMNLSNNKLSPIIIILICYLREKENISVTKGVEGILFRALFLFARRTNQRDSYQLDDVDVLCKLRKLGSYFFDCMKWEKLIFLETELKEFFGNNFDFVTKCGALKKPFSARKDTLVSFEPTHKLFIETLAVSYLNTEFESLQCENDKKKFLTKFMGDFTDIFEFLNIGVSETAVRCNAKSGLELPVYLHFSKNDCATFRCTDKRITNLTAIGMDCKYGCNSGSMILTTLKANFLRCFHPGSGLTNYEYVWRNTGMFYMVLGNASSSIMENYVIFKNVVTRFAKFSSLSVNSSATCEMVLTYLDKRVDYELLVKLFLSLNTEIQEGNFENCLIKLALIFPNGGQLYTVKEMWDFREEISELIPATPLQVIQVQIRLDSSSRIVLYDIG